MYTSLVSISETLRHLLLVGLQSDVGPNGLSDMFTSATLTVSLATPREMHHHEQGLSLWLYRVVRDEMRLNDPSEIHTFIDGRVEIIPPPLPLRLHYLVTPLVNRNPATEQRILGRVLQVFHTKPIIAGADLREDLMGTTAEIHLRLEALSLDETTRVWEALEGSYQLSVSYEVTLANIESIAQPLASRIVESARSATGVIVGGGA